MRKLNLYKVIRYSNYPSIVLIFAYDKESAEQYTVKKYGTTLYTKIFKVLAKCGMVLEEEMRR